MKTIWFRSTVLESAVIGLAFGGWAESTYWSGCGFIVGLTAAVFSFGVLAILRDKEDEQRRNDGKRSNQKGT